MRKLVALVAGVVLASSAPIGCAPAEGQAADKEFEDDFYDDFENDTEEADSEAKETEETDAVDDMFDPEETETPPDPETLPVEEGSEGPGPGEGCAEGEDCAPYCPEGEVCEPLCPDGEYCEGVCPEGDYCGGCPEGEECLSESLPLAPRTHGPISIMQDDLAFANEDNLARAKALGVDVVRIVPRWREMVPGDPNSTKKPGDFVSSHPDGYSWSKFDKMVEGARLQGLKVLLTIPAGPMPYWVSEEPGHCADNSSRSCAWKPQYKEYAAWVTAIGRHVKARGQKIWGVTFVNEPNNPLFLADDSTLRAALRYRKLWFHARKAFSKTAGIKTRYFFGDFGNNPDDLDPTASRWKFFNQALCLDLKGAPDVVKGFCPDKKRRVEANGVAFHPYADTPLEHSRSVSFLQKLVDRAARAKRLPVSRGLYMTESAFFTGRKVAGKEVGVSPAQQAVLMNKADRLLSRNRRVKSIAWNQLVDIGSGLRDSGLMEKSGEEKPSYDAYRVGVDVVLSGDKVEVWGLARASEGSGLVVEGQYGSGEWLEIKAVRTDMTGFARVRVDKGSATAWRIRFGDSLSRVAK